jgi:Mg2+ and Co2+ transporter CorA
VHEADARGLVATLLAEREARSTTADWNDLLLWTRELSGGWLHAMNLDPERFVELARAAGVSEADIGRLLAPDAHAQIRDRDRSTTLILQVPVVPESDISEVYRERVLVMVTRDGVLTGTTGALDLQSAVEDAVQMTHLPEHPFNARVVYAVLAHVRDQNIEVSRRFDDAAHGLESDEAGSGGNTFLTRSFNLRRQLSTAALDLWHVKNVVSALADGRAKLSGTDLTNEKALDTLLAEVDSLYETVNRVKDEVKSLIELHINVKSFEMNRLLKLLAIVSFLGLIPSVIGELLGMNVMGNPWPVTLGQVAFVVAMTMATAMYVFAVKGWLR